VVRSADEVRTLRPQRIPPSNLEAEESVLGSMMLSPDAIADVIEIVQPADFYRSANATIFGTLREIYGRGDPVDAITAVEELKRRGTLEQVGGHLAISDLVDRVPTPAAAASYARIVAETSLLRRLIGAAADIMELAYSAPAEPDEVADAAEQRIYEVARHGEKEQVASLRELVDEAMTDLERIQNRESAFAGVPTGFRDVDSLLSGMQSGNLIVIAARPGVGKSSFVTNVARNVAVDAGQPVAMFSLEMSRWEIGMRLLCGEARVPWDSIRNKRVGAEDWSRIAQAADSLHEAPLFIVDSGNVTLVDIRAKARRLSARRQGLGMIIVDYLQLMSHTRRVDNRQQEIAEISRGLKMLAKELEIPVVAVSQLNRDPERRQDKRPQLSDLRESGAIEQDADVVMFIHRDDSDPAKKGLADLIVAKHRNGPTDTVPLTFLPHLTQFRNHATAVT
jgi:replicative DNA helicase